MALEVNRLAKNIANRKNEHTAKNKFLKTKPKIQEMKQNIDQAVREAKDFHDYILQAEVVMGGGDGGGLSSVPLMEQNSFAPLISTLQDLFNSNVSIEEKTILINDLENSLEIGIIVTNSGQRYLTTRARATQLGGSFQPVTNEMTSQLSKNSGKGKIV
jgi:Cdc6-like AAA superfamily ATPase